MVCLLCDSRGLVASQSARQPFGQGQSQEFVLSGGREESTASISSRKTYYEPATSRMHSLSPSIPSFPSLHPGVCLPSNTSSPSSILRPSSGRTCLRLAITSMNSDMPVGRLASLIAEKANAHLYPQHRSLRIYFFFLLFFYCRQEYGIQLTYI